MKAKLREKEVTSNNMEAKDLSMEKRMELFQEAFRKFEEESIKTFGLAIDVELVFSKKGVVPRMILVDMLKKDKGNGKDENTKTETKSTNQ